jgi:predicted double-glycine peptidase
LPNSLIRLIARVPRPLHVFIFVLPLLISCAGAPDVRESGTTHIIENIPFYPQKAYQCGPASLAGVLNYWQVAVSPEDIASEIYSESAKGTLEEIKRNIDLGHPAIVLVDYGFWVYQQNHFMVVVGYNENGILVNSGKEHLKFISFKRFLKSWKRTEFWTMLIQPEH